MDSFKKARWIGNGLRATVGKTGMVSPAMEFRKEFNIEKMPKTAVCNVCGLGCFELFVNGKKIGDEVLAPPFTNYDKTYYYSVYDVLEQLNQGVNVVAVRVGNGHYNQTAGDAWAFESASWRDNPKLALSLDIDDKTILVTDTSWKVRKSKISYHNNIRTGEFYDATKEDGFCLSNYNDGDWYQAKIVAPPSGKAVRDFMPPIRECQVIKPIDIKKTQNGWLFDFGINIAGYAEICSKEPCGTQATMRYAEQLDGVEINQKEIAKHVYSGEFSTDKYTFKGEGTERWKPSFVYHGFRYVEVLGLTTEPTKDTLTAYFIHTDFEKIGDFSTSDEFLTWIYECGIRSFLSNYQSIPTDCPHREKNGWTGDAHLSCEYALRLYDMESSYKKWLTDIIDCQKDNGILACIVPTSAWGYNWGTGPSWDYVLFKIPYAIYLETGKTEYLKMVYESALKYLDYALNYRTDGLVEFGLKDWCYPTKVDNIKIASNELSDSCFYFDMQKITAFIATLNGDTATAERLLEQAEETRCAIIEKYIEGDLVDGGGQGAAALVLSFGVVEGEKGQKIADKLAKIIKADDYKIKVGILGFRALMYALPQYGYQDVVYKMINRYDYPSFGYWKNNGATSLWEDWEGSQSLNHHMYGTVIDYLQRDIAGVKNMGIAYDEVLIEPYFYAENCSASLSKQTINGLLKFEWKKEKDDVKIVAVIPNGTKARLKIAGKTYELKAGKTEKIFKI